MKLEDVKSKIDGYFNNVSTEELYRRSINIYNFIDNDLSKDSKSSNIKIVDLKVVGTTLFVTFENNIVGSIDFNITDYSISTFSHQIIYSKSTLKLNSLLQENIISKYKSHSNELKIVQKDIKKFIEHLENYIEALRIHNYFFINNS